MWDLRAVDGALEESKVGGWSLVYGGGPQGGGRSLGGGLRAEGLAAAGNKRAARTHSA